MLEPPLCPQQGWVYSIRLLGAGKQGAHRQLPAGVPAPSRAESVMAAQPDGTSCITSSTPPSAVEIVTAQLPSRNVKVTPASKCWSPQSRTEAHMAEFIASYIALPITIVIAVSVVIYLVVQLRTVGEKDK
jgi:hypothetical protein